MSSLERVPPTLEQFSKYQQAWAWFNAELFDGKLNPCLLNFSRHRGSLGFFTPCRWRKGDKEVHEISLNPDRLSKPLEDVMSTLVHEMVHQWQFDLGDPPRSGYHDMQWAEKMVEVGLIPSDTGEPGGKPTGQMDKAGKQQRIITYGVHPVAREIKFDGQIIFTGNRPLLDIPELRALATRIPIIHLPATRPELIARMKSLALQGYESDKGKLTSEMCCEVLKYLITVYPADRMYDIRILIRCFDDRIGVINLGKTLSSSWKELVLSQVSSNVGPPVTRQDKITRETVIALELAGKKLSQKELVPEWQKRTGRKTLDTYYRRLRKLRELQ